MPPFNVEVIWAKATPIRVQVTATEGMTVEQVIAASGIFSEHKELEHLKFGRFGRFCDKSACVNPGDRLEIYEPISQAATERRFKRINKRQED